MCVPNFKSIPRSDLNLKNHKTVQIKFKQLQFFLNSKKIYHTVGKCDKVLWIFCKVHLQYLHTCTKFQVDISFYFKAKKLHIN